VLDWLFQMVEGGQGSMALMFKEHFYKQLLEIQTMPFGPLEIQAMSFGPIGGDIDVISKYQLARSF
jgi:hypothetical protein